MHKEANTNLFHYLKERVTILQVVGEHVALKKAGHYWKGRCPFHDEKTASFTVSPHREIFYCFGCHMGGDVITFISKTENCNQLEAAKLLADRYNIELPETIIPESFEQKTDDRKKYFEICKLVAQWTHEQIEKYPSTISYLNKRGFTQESINAFKVGYFPGGTKAIRTLIKYCAQHNFLAKDLLEAQIISDGKANFYSPFEQRIIFPIRDHLGRFCGFGGRITKSTDERPKYYNSRENSYFQKGSLLFGLAMAKKVIQKEKAVFLVEGYTDCIAMVQHGIQNTVATLGTACTLEHLKLLSYHAHKVYLVYDGDQAGQKAMLRLAQLCWQVNLDLKVIFLPETQDPASFLQEGGDLLSLAESAQDILSFFLDHMGKEFSSQSLAEKLEGMNKFLAIIKNIDDKLKQEILLQKASSVFSISFDSLKTQLARTRTQPLQNTPEEAPEDTNKLVLDDISKIEKNFICAILNNTQFLEQKEVDNLVEYMPQELQTLLQKLKSAKTADDKITFTLFFDTLEYHEKQVVNQLLLAHDYEDSQENFEQMLLLLEKKYWKMIVNGTKVKITLAQKEADTKKVTDIVSSFLELKKKLLRKGLI